MRYLSNILILLALSMIKVYQRVISPLLPPSCRFYPSCSQYFIEIIQQRGLLAGLLLGMRRISRCHPWSTGGFDPVLKEGCCHRG